jgi:pyridoxal phosphate enzyme (YggS family)
VTDIAARLADVRDRLSRAASRAGRSPSAVRLIAVSKTFSADDVRAAAAAGQIDFGENKVQEALTKIDALAAGASEPTSGATIPAPLRWHLIGHLQSNKARKAAGRFDAIHSIDSVSLLHKVDEGAAAAQRRVDLLVQVDLAGELTKHGAREDELAEIFSAAASLSSARVVGLMLVPPAVDDPEAARPYFRQLREVSDRLLAAGVPAGMLGELSMGMSHDFEVAIEEGSTMIRVGSAIFGGRRYPPATP